MVIFKVAKKNILRNIRDIKAMCIMTLMPILIILMMGVALAGLFEGNELSMRDVHLEYLVKGEKGVFTKGFESLIDEMMTDGSSFLEIKDREQSINRLKNDDISSLIEIDEENKTIVLNKNNIYNTEASIIEGVLNTYVSRFNVVHEIINVNPQLIKEVSSKEEGNSYVTLKSLNRKESPSAMDYYGVAMCILFVLYGIMTLTSDIIIEKGKGTLARILLSPISKKELLLGNALGGVGTTTIQIGLIMLATLLIYNVNWGDNPIYAFILIFTEIIMAMSIGTALGFLFDSEGKALGLIQVFAGVTALFGGSYMPLQGLGLFGEIGKYISPIWWTNGGMFEMIYTGRMNSYYAAIAVNLGVAVLFLLIASWKITKKEGLING